MFTGIVQAVGKVEAIEVQGEDACMTVDAAGLDLGGHRGGESIAVNGVCLTARDHVDGGFIADVSRETLSRTALGQLGTGDPVNLEPALTLSTPLGGHLVSGHVDGVGEVVVCEPVERSVRLRLRVPAELARYIAVKGSICVDGVSLTVNAVEDAAFEVNIVPHTLEATIMKGYEVGTWVNLEVDLVARYLERLLLGTAAGSEAEALIRERLAAYSLGHPER